MIPLIHPSIHPSIHRDNLIVHLLKTFQLHTHLLRERVGVRARGLGEGQGKADLFTITVLRFHAPLTALVIRLPAVRHRVEHQFEVGLHRQCQVPRDVRGPGRRCFNERLVQRRRRVLGKVPHQHRKRDEGAGIVARGGPPAEGHRALRRVLRRKLLRARLGGSHGHEAELLNGPGRRRHVLTGPVDHLQRRGGVHLPAHQDPGVAAPVHRRVVRPDLRVAELRDAAALAPALVRVRGALAVQEAPQGVVQQVHFRVLTALHLAEHDALLFALPIDVVNLCLEGRL